VRRIFVVLAGAATLAALWVLWPYPEPRVSIPAPARDYDEAGARLARLSARDPAGLTPGCATYALLHGRRTPRAIVLLHGITNCPLQFRGVAESLAAGGDNLLVPRVDHHGLADRMTTDLARLTAEEEERLAAECVAIARGLGDTVVVTGLSTSGVAAAWAAERVPGVDRAVLIAPAFAPAFLRPPVPHALASLLTRLALRLPNEFVWWDAKAKQALQGPTQSYVRFPTHALAQAYRLGEAVCRAGPGARDVAFVLSDADEAVENGRSVALADAWQRDAPAMRLRIVDFPAREHVLHDMVDPAQVGARPDVVWPVLIALIRGQGLPPGTPARESAPGAPALAAR
jgi:carboxylesterase